jgi:hypothetical protein
MIKIKKRDGRKEQFVPEKIVVSAIKSGAPPDFARTIAHDREHMAISPRLPRSSKKVMMILISGHAMTHKDLVKETNLHPRTVRFALKKLKDQELLIEKLKMDDFRQILY